MASLQDLWESLLTDAPDESGYDAARAAKVAEISAYIVPFISGKTNVTAIAESCMTSAEGAGRIFGNSISAEVGSSYTRDRMPLVFTL